MKRSELKAIIKECLVEILAEGMGGGLKGQISEASARQPQQQRPAPHMRRQPQAAPAQNPMKEHIKALTTGNDVLADMLAQTAVTTLPMQMQAPDPERSLAGVQAMMGAGGSQGFYPNMPQDPEPAADFYPMISEASAHEAPVRGGGNPMWDQLAFGTPSAGGLARLAPPPAATRKLSAAELDRKVG